MYLFLEDFIYISPRLELGWRYQYSDYIVVGMIRGSNPSGTKNLSLFLKSRPAMRRTHPPIQ